MRWFLVLLFLTILPAAAPAEDRPRAGLMWNRSALPATFPLVVKTPPGRDYVLFVTAPEAGEAAMAGYIRGGEFFRLLLPPGEWRLRFAFGEDWQGETDLFGPATGWTGMQQALDFRVLGVNRRRAYVVTLAERDGGMTVAEARAGAECQRLLWDSTDRLWPEDLPGVAPDDPALRHRPPRPWPRPRLRYIDRGEYGVYTRFCG